MVTCKMIDIALEKDLIHKNPFREYEITMQEKDRGYLLKEEIEQLLSCTFKSKTRELVRDLFVFSCFTGLSYIDIKQLKKEPNSNLFLMAIVGFFPVGKKRAILPMFAYFPLLKKSLINTNPSAEVSLYFLSQVIPLAIFI
ncbi:hypothetical protein QIU18_02775 [Capnocytophaga canimorsus]|nr:hypothetical protein [Capnocytophaga canimorsus]WGU70969.1 hypothetical protein QIU18_02775 [Capnocytophaga canimorsus]